MTKSLKSQHGAVADYLLVSMGHVFIIESLCSTAESNHLSSTPPNSLHLTSPIFREPGVYVLSRGFPVSKEQIVKLAVLELLKFEKRRRRQNSKTRQSNPSS